MRIEQADLSQPFLSVMCEGIRETKRIGVFLGENAMRGDVIALVGELGSGKTQIAKGIAKGLGFPERMVTSPSYTLINEYPARLPFYHIDLYRLNGFEELHELGYEEYLYGDGVTAIEWADRIEGVFEGDDHLRVAIMVTGKRSRRLELSGRGKRATRLIENLNDYLKSFLKLPGNHK